MIIYTEVNNEGVSDYKQIRSRLDLDFLLHSAS